jgi:signal transduction histidine kinase
VAGIDAWLGVIVDIGPLHHEAQALAGGEGGSRRPDLYFQRHDLTGLKLAMEHIRNLSQTMMQAQERERQMISYELHDRIAQNLSSLKMGCDLLFDGQSDIPPEIIEKKIKLSKEIEQIIISVRDLSYDLRPPGIDEMGLVTAIEIYCEEFSEKSGLKVEFQSAGMHQFDSGYEVGIHIYRLIQEGLNNIQKHADADRVTIKLVGASPNIILRIEDNGKGFNVRERELALGKEKRMGLRSMKERVNLLGGEITIQSRLKKGTKIFIKLPLKEKSSDLEKTRNHR